MLNFHVVAPAVESLLDLDRADSLWPSWIKEDARIKEQAALRKSLLTRLNILLEQIKCSEMEVTKAIDMGLADVQNAIELYKLLADFLEADPLHKRIVLYLPLELLPHQSWRHESSTLMLAQKRFVTAYMDRWWELLSICDAEANFIDGDILETECRDTPTKMVIQVTRFIPQLLAKKLISTEEVKGLINANRGNILELSIAEVFPTRTVRQPSVPQGGVVTQDRARWLRGEKFKRKIKEAAENLSAEISKALVPPEEFEKRCINIFSTLVGIQSLRVTGDRYYEYEEFIRELWGRDIPHFRDAIISLWSHLFHLNVISKAYLDQFAVRLPSLDGSFSEVCRAVSCEARKLAGPVKLPFLYPAFIIFGSQLKGYGNSASDYDVAVFARSTMTLLERRLIEQTLGDKVVVFELEETCDGFEITNLPDWTHVLFGGAWCGNREFIEELREKLFLKYLNESSERRTWFEQMERDAIQYRLLHSGYDRFFPKQSDLGTFYDPGFRRLATKIFLKRVFLPIKST